MGWVALLVLGEYLPVVLVSSFNSWLTVLLGRKGDRGPGITLVYTRCKVRHAAMALMDTKRARRRNKKGLVKFLPISRYQRSIRNPIYYNSRVRRSWHKDHIVGQRLCIHPPEEKFRCPFLKLIDLWKILR
jgi:hypothetical protein